MGGRKLILTALLNLVSSLPAIYKDNSKKQTVILDEEPIFYLAFFNMFLH